MRPALANPGIPHSFRLLEHGVRVPSQDQVDLRSGGGKFVILTVPNVGERDQQIALRSQSLGGFGRHRDGRIPEKGTCCTGSHTFGDHRNHHAEHSDAQSVALELQRLFKGSRSVFPAHVGAEEGMLGALNLLPKRRFEDLRFAIPNDAGRAFEVG